LVLIAGAADKEMMIIARTIVKGYIAMCFQVGTRARKRAVPATLPAGCVSRPPFWKAVADLNPAAAFCCGTGPPFRLAIWLALRFAMLCPSRRIGYLELGGVNALARDLRERNIRTKSRLLATGATRGGVPFGRGSLFYLLRNRFYIGEVSRASHSR
jgi:hypothetical protein